LSRISEKLKKPADELARVALGAWQAVMASDAPTPGQMTGTVHAFEQWDASGNGDPRATAWYADFALGLARRPQRWPAEFLSAAIVELEGAEANNAGRIDRHLAALALRSQRLLVLAVKPEPTDEELAQIEQDSSRLVAARNDEEDGPLIGRFVEPMALLDALWAEAQLTPLAGMASPAIPAEVTAAPAGCGTRPGAVQRRSCDRRVERGLFAIRVDLHRRLPVRRATSWRMSHPPMESIWLRSPGGVPGGRALLDLAEQARTPDSIERPTWPAAAGNAARHCRG
jgi:hypothetical protein